MKYKSTPVCWIICDQDDIQDNENGVELMLSVSLHDGRWQRGLLKYNVNVASSQNNQDDIFRYSKPNTILLFARVEFRSVRGHRYNGTPSTAPFFHAED